MAQIYNKSKILEAIKVYETETLGKTFQKQLSETPLILSFKGGRKEKLSILSLHVWPEIDIYPILDNVVKIIDSNTNLSDSINLYSTANIDSVVEEKLRTIALSKYDLSLDVYDISRMRNISAFHDVFQNDAEDEEITFIEKALYDYLASSEDSSYLKNSLYYSLILLVLYNFPDGISLQDLDETLFARTGKKVEKLDVVIRVLRKDGHIEQPKAGDSKLYLSQSERDAIMDSIRRTKAAEAQFDESYSQIVTKFRINEPRLLTEKLRDIIIAECKNVETQTPHSGYDNEYKEKDPVSVEDYIADLKSFVSPEELKDFVKEISCLLNNNSYLITLSLGEKFLDLYKSDRYEQYINKKNNFVVLDTMVFAYLLCCFSSYNDEIGEQWNDIDYQRVLDLYGYWKEHDKSVTLAIPVDYIDETIGELRKALQLTWFSGFKLEVPLATSNIFYNYYLHVCREKQIYDESMPTFEMFLMNFGFRNLDVDSVYFKRDAAKTLNALLNTMGIELWTEHPHFDHFEDVKHEYQIKLANKNKNKSDAATNNDVRLSFYLAQEYSVEYHFDDEEYYWTSWDKTLKELRRITNDSLTLTHSYEIRTPGDLIQTLAFKSFHLDRAKIGNEVFAYANEVFGFTSKASSLFDNILNPYFASKNNKNTELVNLLLKLETAREQQPNNMEDSSRSNTRSVLEDFFMMIIDRLARNSCGTSELRDYLADSVNNEEIINIFTQAYSSDSEDIRIKLAYQFVDSIKQFVMDRQTQPQKEQS